MTEYNVSIVIPAYNCSKHIKECIQSATNQTLREIEIIIVNDASTDDTGSIIEDFSKRNANIIIINHAINRGQGAARNNGIARARGKYIFLLDADDSIPPKSLDTLYRIAEEYSSDIVFGKTNSEVSQDGNYILSEMRNVSLETYPALVYNHSVWNKLYLREFLLGNRLRFEPPRCAEDVSFSIRTNLVAKSISITTRETYNYRFGRQIDYTTKQKIVDAFHNVTNALTLVEKSSSPLLIREMRRKTARNAYASMIRAERVMSRDELKKLLAEWQTVLQKMPDAIINSIPPRHSEFCKLVIDGDFEAALLFRERQIRSVSARKSSSSAKSSPLRWVCRKLCSQILK